MNLYEDEELDTANLDAEDTENQAEESEGEEGWFGDDSSPDAEPIGETEQQETELYDPTDEYDSEDLSDMAEEKELAEQEFGETDGEWDTTADPDSDELSDMAEEQEDEEAQDAEMREWAMEQHLENDARNEIEQEERQHDY